MSELSSLLTGSQVRLWPYSPASYPPDTLVELWRLLQAERAQTKVFWSRAHQVYSDPAPLAWFMGFMQSVILMLPQDLESGALMGFCWFDDIVHQHRAAQNIFYARRFWGSRAQEASTLCARYGHEVMGWPTLWGLTPWPLAVRHAEVVGFRYVATLEDYAFIEGKSHDVHVVRKGQ